MLLSIINAFRNGTVSTIGQEQWLKTLHKRFNLQPKQEWSDEDEKKILFLERLIRYNVPEGQYGWVDGHKGGFVTKLEAISMLKSLRPHWKPSEEQMEAYPRTNQVQYYHREGFVLGYEQAEKDLKWHTVDEALPPMDEEVIVLLGEWNEVSIEPLYRIAFGHVVNKEYCEDFSGWNIPGVSFWMPMPEIPKEEKK